MKLKDFREAFFKGLERKPGWGRNEIKTLFDNTFIELTNPTVTYEPCTNCNGLGSRDGISSCGLCGGTGEL